jgi:hypothetical protein
MSHAAGEAGFVKGDLSGGQRIEWSNWAFFIFIFFHFLKALLTLFLYAKENSLGPRLLMDRNQISIVVVFASISFKVLRYYVQAQINKKASML